VIPQIVEEAGNQLETSVEESHKTLQSSGFNSLASVACYWAVITGFY